MMLRNGVLLVTAFLMASAARAQAPAENVAGGPPLALAAQIDLETALQWTLQNNPNLVTTRQNLSVASQAVDVARHFPVSLNPSISVTCSPWVFERQPNGEVDKLDRSINVTWAQPVELGRQQVHREEMAEAAYTQTQWTVLQAELAALTQTYRSHQTALYRREKLAIAQELNSFSTRLVETLRRQEEAKQAAAADVLLAEVENQTTVDLLEAARQDYISALADLRQQIGMPSIAASAEPIGSFRVPQENIPAAGDALVQLAQQSRPEVQSAAGAAAVSRAALAVARGDRIPTPSIGPVYERNETGAVFYGLALSSPVPIINSGRPLVAQREAEYRRDCVAWDQARQLVAVQVLATTVKWNQSRYLAEQTHARLQTITSQHERMQRLYEAGETDLLKLLQVRRRFIEARNVELDAIWQTTQAYADLLNATGGTPLLNGPAGGR
jgi:outer membrane protein, heavy metal efflux system